MDSSTLPFIERDPWLWPVAGRIEKRHADYLRTKAWIEAEYGSLYEFANAHHFYGLHPLVEDGGACGGPSGAAVRPRGWVFREWLPQAKDVFLTGDFNGWDYTSHPLRKICGGDGRWHGDWEIRLDNPDDACTRRLTHGSCYKIYVHGADGAWHLRLPAYTFYTEQDPDTKEFKAKVWAPETAPGATPGKATTGPDAASDVRPDGDSSGKPSADTPTGSTDAGASVGLPGQQPTAPFSPLIYEAHIGMAQEKEGVGTYREFTENVLPRIREDGYNTIQLMGIAEHPYYGSFGYHVSNFFAPSSRFGTPDDLKDLIRAAHAMGLTVLMDVVHAHFVSNLNEGLWALDGSPDLYNYPEPHGTHPHWGSKMFAFRKNEVRRFLLSNLRYWTEEFGFDGFRFDGVTAMIYFHRGYTDLFGTHRNYFGEEVDEDALIYLRLANDLLRELTDRRMEILSSPAAERTRRPQPPRPMFSIAEEVSGMPGTTVPCAEGGLGFDYRLSMGIPDFWIKLLKERRDEDWVMRELWTVLNDRLPNVPQIAYCESHDQALVGDQTLAFRLMGAHMYTEMGIDTPSPVVERGMALHKMIRLISLFAGGGGGGYLDFMGNEFGHPEWIDFPREGNGWSYRYARRQWSLADRPELRYRLLLAFDHAMIGLARETGLQTMGFGRLLCLDETAKILAFDLCDGRYVLAFNWHVSDSRPDYRLPVYQPGRYRLRLSSDDTAFGGFGRTDAETRYFSQPYNAAGGHDTTGGQSASPSDAAHTAQYLPVYLVNRAAQVWVLEE